MADSAATSAEASDIADAVALLTAATDRVVETQSGADVADADIAGAIVSAAKLFSAKTDRVGRFPWPIETDALNATDTVRLVTALLDAADINIFDMAIWYRRAE